MATIQSRFIPDWASVWRTGQTGTVAPEYPNHSRQVEKCIVRIMKHHSGADQCINELHAEENKGGDSGESGVFVLHYIPQPLYESYNNITRIQSKNRIKLIVIPCCSQTKIEPPHEKPTIRPVWPAKTQISLHVHLVPKGSLLFLFG